MDTPVFRKDIIQPKRVDGYWIETFKLDPKDELPGLIVYATYEEKAIILLTLHSYGLDTGIVEFLDNPLNERPSYQDSDRIIVPETANKPAAETHEPENKVTGWKATRIAHLDSPVAVAVADVDNDGSNDLIICYNYGNDFIDCNPKGGYIAWLKNPGRANLDHGDWDLHYIGRWPAMHRLKVGYFTQR